MQEQGLDAMFTVNYHDEVVIEVIDDEESINKVKNIIDIAVDRCNKFFKFRVPMDMDKHVGPSWREIH
jgi:DNA polymerase I-like protein with 3'-5' exonuclease and polymerase domains